MIDKATSSFLAPSLSNGWISVLANTPQREAIGYIWVPSLANSFNPSVVVFKRTAIWSRKAPVPPAHEPFILCSIVWSK